MTITVWDIKYFGDPLLYLRFGEKLARVTANKSNKEEREYMKISRKGDDDSDDLVLEKWA